MPKKAKASSARRRSNSLIVEVIAEKGLRVPRAFVDRAVQDIRGALLKKPRGKSAIELSAEAVGLLTHAKILTIAFVSGDEIQAHNQKYRGKNKPTDILSFAPIDENSLGELMVALDVIRAQAKDHGLTLNQELAYMILHGMLHLLGYDHERSEREAKTMFAIQDRVFDLVF